MAWDELAQAVSGLTVYETAVQQAELYYRADLTGPLALLIGAEAEGVSPQGHALAHKSLHIPMPGGSESLNAAVAAAILMFDVVRQRALMA
jgi:TrmH family RNA methyltransferase